MYVCVYVCIYSCIYVFIHVSIHVCIAEEELLHIGAISGTLRAGSFEHVAGIDRDYPDGRAVYVSRDRKLVIAINDIDHVRVIARERGSNLLQAFQRAGVAVREIDKFMFRYEEALKVIIPNTYASTWSGGSRDKSLYQRSLAFGNVSTFVDGVGCGMKISYILKLPRLSQNLDDLFDTCESLNLAVEPFNKFNKNVKFTNALSPRVVSPNITNSDIACTQSSSKLTTVYSVNTNTDSKILPNGKEAHYSIFEDRQMTLDEIDTYDMFHRGSLGVGKAGGAGGQKYGRHNIQKNRLSIDIANRRWSAEYAEHEKLSVYENSSKNSHMKKDLRINLSKGDIQNTPPDFWKVTNRCSFGMSESVAVQYMADALVELNAAELLCNSTVSGKAHT
jgi:hypothetical protein